MTRMRSGDDAVQTDIVRASERSASPSCTHGSRIAWRLSVGTAALVLVLLTTVAPTPAYVRGTIDFVDGAPVFSRWSTDAFPLGFQVTTGLTNDIGGTADRDALVAALGTWTAAPDSTVSLFLAGEGDVEAGVLDGVNALEFSNAAALDNAGFSALAFFLSDPDGTITEADLLINDRRFGFATDGGNVGLDLETFMVRQLGSLLGLDSSPLGGPDPDDFSMLSGDTSVMFPVTRGIGDLARALRQDDIAGIAALYPLAGSSRGAIRGRVARQGSPVFGAHVVAFDPASQVLVGAVSLPDGSFSLEGLPPGRYLIQAVPLNNQAGPATLGGIFALGTLNTSFRAAFHSDVIRLSAGATITGLTLEVL